jgi:hypothetical protein
MTVADHITPDEVYRHIKKRAAGDPDAEHMARSTGTSRSVPPGTRTPSTWR